jgi:ribonuclease G
MNVAMERELVIQATDLGCDIALLENKELVEFHRESRHNTLIVGDIYWARVKKIMPPLNAVFIDIGEGKEAFLHYTDLGEKFSSFRAYFNGILAKESPKIEKFNIKSEYPKDGKIGEILKVNDYLAVQILKEPMSSKGARLSADLSIAGRYLVLTPFMPQSNISKKISNPIERSRLREITSKLTINNMGVIIRTVAEGKTVKELHEDFNELLEKWQEICNRIKSSNGIVKLFEEQSKSNTLLRDVLNDSFTKIHVHGSELSTSIQTYVDKIAPEKSDIIKTYEKEPVFEVLNLVPKIKSSFNKIIPLPSGGYLIIEQTEAMCVIDVNSGVHKAKKDLVESNDSIFKTNTEAAKEIARQLRLRDIGGIIVIDFIDTKVQETREAIYESMLDFMRTDKASHTVLPLSKFCLMQITRSRTKPQEKVNTREVCPSCKGTGKVSNVIFITEHIYNRLQAALKIDKNLTLTVHPFVYAYLKQGWLSEFLKWQWQLKTHIKLHKNSGLGVVDFSFTGKTGEVILNS